MEAVPRMPMIWLDLKEAAEFQFGPSVKQFILKNYGEDPENYNEQLKKLEQLRQGAVNVTRDFEGCSTLRKYFGQLHYLQSRVPMGSGQEAAVPITWTEIFSGKMVTHDDISYEQACILYNLGVLHSMLGAVDNRVSEEGMKVSCTHFQCSAGAFSYLRDHFSHDFSVDMSHQIINLNINLMLGQAQECLLEKSMLDNRKSFLVARISAQVVDYYKEACRAMENLETASLLGKIQKDWKKLVQIKIYYFAAIAHLHMGKQAEEQQKYGEQLAYLQSALDKLNEAVKLAKNQPENVQEALRFTMDVIGGKFSSAKKDNDFIYHESVPALETLPSVKGAPLVKALPVNPTDPSVTGPDLFSKLVPMAAHEASSLYSEEKAKLLRDVMAKINSKNETLEQFMDSLRLDPETVDNLDMYSHIPPVLMEKCAALSVRPDTVKNLIQSMQVLSGVFTDVEASLREIRELLEEEQAQERRLEEAVGKQAMPPLPPALAELTKDLDKYMEVHEKASFTNTELHRAMNLHIANLRLLGGPLESLSAALPSPELTEEDAAVLQSMKRILGKVQEMRDQRRSLEKQLRDLIHKDDITSALVTTERSEMKKLFEEQLKKYEQVKVYIDQNLAAQENILKALTEANVQYASVRKGLAETEHKWNTTVQTLVSSYEAYEDLMKKSQEGKEFYDDLEGKASRLLERARSTCQAREQERQQSLDRELQKKPPPRPTAPKPPLQKKPSDLDSSLDDAELQQLNAAILALGGDLPEELRSLPPNPTLPFPGVRAPSPGSMASPPLQPPMYWPGAVMFNQPRFPAHMIPTEGMVRQPHYPAVSGLPQRQAMPPHSAPARGHLPPHLAAPQHQPPFTTEHLGGMLPQHVSPVPGYGMGPQGGQTPTPHTGTSVRPAMVSQSGQPQLSGVAVGGPGVRPSTTTVDSLQTPISSFTSPGHPGQPSQEAPIGGMQLPRQQIPTTGGYRVPPMGQYPPLPTATALWSASRTVLSQYGTAAAANAASLSAPAAPRPGVPRFSQAPCSAPTLPTVPAPAEAAAPPHFQPPSHLPTQKPAFPGQPHMQAVLPPQPYLPPQPRLPPQPHLPPAPISSQPHMQPSSQPHLPPASIPAQPHLTSASQPHMHPQMPQQASGAVCYPRGAAPHIFPHQTSQTVPPQQAQLLLPHPSIVQPLPPVSSTAPAVGTMPYPPAPLQHQGPLAPHLLPHPPATQIPQQPPPNAISPSPAPSPSPQPSPGPPSLGLIPQRPPPSLTPSLPAASSSPAPSSSSEVLFQRPSSTTDDLLSSSPESQHGGPKAAAAVLLPTKADPQDGQRKKKPEGVRLIEGDPYQAPELVTRLWAELERFRAVVEALEKPGPGTSELDARWKELQDLQEKDARQLSIAIARCYSMKNRHQDIMPYDRNRVVLQSGKDDYINASTVEELSPYCPRIIATQAPLTGTATDFWLMIYEQKVSLIVMLVSEQELKKQKVLQYFPLERGQQVSQGPITLTLTTLKVTPTHIERMIGLQYRDQSLKRTVIHLQFTSWPELSLPDSNNNLIRFIQEVHGHYLHQRPLHTPIVVHCSSGVGRTGAFCLLYAAMQEVEAGNAIPDLPLLVRKMRQQRKNMLQEKLHLKFCYETVLKHAEQVLQRHGVSTAPCSKTTNSAVMKPYSRQESQDIVLGGDMPISSIQATIAKMSIRPPSSCGQSLDFSDLDSLPPAQPSLPAFPVIQLQPDLAVPAQSCQTAVTTTPPDSCSATPPPAESEGHVNSNTTEHPLPEPDLVPAPTPVSSSSLDLLASLTPEAFTLDAASKGKQRINKHCFLQPQNGQGLQGASSGDDPLSSLDPLWTLNKT
ncbi:LOW QUALITY PROTEIN: tyrosine-protein phosphatase non-receptor type 23-like [Acipenser ruthenus]|uniref:LOW QUALITY PROTEIN: tyrosine-protein phosphatase non-receptor type 23-like n=1 Tax=Acipenser ruthenus TaxID=7906 RepID=UPI002740F6C6|nr:LOW QUALITY PROTEIN: tyrosine-protein phosphatase non-receptor type 23-like [Acipenser ruthenus]